MSYPVNPTPPLPFPSSSVDPYSLASFDQDLTRALHAYLSDLARRVNDMLPKNGSESMSGPLTISNVAGSAGDVWGGRLITLSNFAPGIYIQDRTAAAIDVLASLDADQLKLFSTTAGDGSDLVVRYTFNMSSGFAQYAGLYLTHTGTATVAGTDHAYQIGSTSSTNLIADKEGFMARNNGVISTLYLQKGGGAVQIGSAIYASADANGGIEIGRQDGTTSTPFIDFHTGTTVVDYDARIIASGSTGSSGGGSLTLEAASVDLPKGRLAFPPIQNASPDANTLDDYEEGTWTPVLAFGGGSSGITYSSQVGIYTKIGNVVTLGIIIILTNKGSSTGTATITGLPFATAAAGIGVSVVMTDLSGLTGATVAGASGGTTQFTIYNTTTTGIATLTDANFTNNTTLRATFTYLV